MNIAHITGHHETQSLWQLASHLLLSWAGIIIAAVIVSAVLYYIYKNFRLQTKRQRSNK